MNYKFYKLPNGTQADGVIRTTVDGIISVVPFAETNTDYQKYLEWLAEGNTTEAAD
tara:strand:+ start:1528 stop:1695 length:168 start_codon:yes stop_codon:yes gene_type:complete